MGEQLMKNAVFTENNAYPRFCLDCIEIAHLTIVKPKNAFEGACERCKRAVDCYDVLAIKLSDGEADFD